jgi:hypothetical protein
MRHSVILSASFVILSAANDLLSAQSLESRIAGARGSVSFSYATRPNVCGTDDGIEISRDSSPGWTIQSRRSGIHIGTHRGDRYERCELGPAHVLLRRDAGQVSEVSVRVGGRPDAAGTHLGDVRSADAAHYLLAIAPRLTGRSADRAVLAAQIADGADTWQRLAEIAHDEQASEASRKSSVFWLAQRPGEAGLELLTRVLRAAENIGVRKDALFHVAQMQSDRAQKTVRDLVLQEGVPASLRNDALFHAAQRSSSETHTWLASVIANEQAPLETRKNAVFFIAQRQAGASAAIAAVYDGSLPLQLKKDLVFHIAQRHDSTSLDKLIAIAKSDPNRELRKDALFHLGQSRHPRAMKALEELVLP